jgi:hypothetical protein
MWKRKARVTPGLGADIRIILPAAALTVIFDECDGFDRDETGGRVIGTYATHGGKLTINVTGVIESGPQARRSAVSFFQDGEYQEGVFRHIESHHPETEHLGNWHTHHVNGLSTLSGGDIATYHRIVNHHNHNTPFFYALLVTAKHHGSDPLRRYSIKHFVFRRGKQEFHEIPPQHVEMAEGPLVWPASAQPAEDDRLDTRAGTTNLGIHPERVYDRDIIQEFYQGFRPFASQKLGMYWRGSLELLDGSRLQVVILEDSRAHARYTVALREPPEVLHEIAEQLAQRDYPSARAALINTERSCNHALYQYLDHKHRHHNPPSEK